MRKISANKKNFRGHYLNYLVWNMERAKPEDSYLDPTRHISMCITEQFFWVTTRTLRCCSTLLLISGTPKSIPSYG